MLPIKYIGEQFYVDHRVTINGEAQPLTEYLKIKAYMIGYNGKIIKYAYPEEEGCITIARPDDYTLRYFVDSESTKILGEGKVRLEIKVEVEMQEAPKGVLKPIFVGDIYMLKPSKIGQDD